MPDEEYKEQTALDHHFFKHGQEPTTPLQRWTTGSSSWNTATDSAKQPVNQNKSHCRFLSFFPSKNKY